MEALEARVARSELATLKKVIRGRRAKQEKPTDPPLTPAAPHAASVSMTRSVAAMQRLHLAVPHEMRLPLARCVAAGEAAQHLVGKCAQARPKGGAK